MTCCAQARTLYNVQMAKALATKRSTKKVSAEVPAKVVSESMVDNIHRELRDMAITFRFLPGERLNEAVLAKELGVSRTPLREALNRLSAEGFLTFSVNQGFFRKPLDVKEIFDLYEFRQQMEMAAMRLAVERATDEQLAELEQFAEKSAEDIASRTVDELISLDEQFHERIITLTGNIEMRNSLRNVNDRIQYVRWLDMNGRRSETQSQHKEIVRALMERNIEKSVQLISAHIGHRLDQIIDKVERSYGRIYVSAGRPSV
jgi:DNA-binding GntR family transcriptional regulator